MNSTPKSFSILSRLASRELCEAFCIFYCLVYSMGKAKTTFLRGFPLPFFLSGIFRKLPLHSANHCANIQKLNKNPGVAKFGIALEWGSRGRWFESSHSDQKGLTAYAVGPFCICNPDSNQRPFARSAIKSSRLAARRLRRTAGSNPVTRTKRPLGILPRRSFAFAMGIRTSGRLRGAQSNPAALQPAARGGLPVRIQSLGPKVESR